MMAAADVLSRCTARGTTPSLPAQPSTIQPPLSAGGPHQPYPQQQQQQQHQSNCQNHVLHHPLKQLSASFPCCRGVTLISTKAAPAPAAVATSLLLLGQLPQLEALHVRGSM
jgi:hypothetical protein